MTQPITEIPLSELHADLDASLNDIKVCELALLQGVTVYFEGTPREFSVQARLDINRDIVARIEAEIARREAAA